MSRAFLVVLDSVGIGGAPDADQYFNDGLPDTGACTLGHIADACAQGRSDDGRQGPLHLPHMGALGLFHALELGCGTPKAGLCPASPTGRWGAATEVSKGKDTPSGHWELAGLPVPWDWHYFPKTTPAFPQEITDLVCEIAGVDGILGNCHGSGTAMIDVYGEEHLKTGYPICYTSVDSVFQIAAHEETFGLNRLLQLCETLAPHLHKLRLGRVIARPFVGGPGNFIRTPNRHDYAMALPAPVLTNWVQDAGRRVYAVGKIGDIFSMTGIDEVRKGPDEVLMRHLSDLVDEAEDGSLTFANFVEFDSLYGHRRDIAGYARHLEWFDAELGKLLARLRPGDMLLLTADHGNDPSWHGSDHTRERVPVVIAGLGAGSVGQVGFVDVGASIAAHLGVPSQGPGKSFL
ncbi:phosphopentomutase [Tropicibacter oceani]|uniref:Phosphopentomutase n=1 Tax=Tropicibacter oceani TaxID=3058420 RepID=A0ABY8QLJ9_9RHOB|nr:phosphopentomutase [Tropicibacter oceani]WGW05509.1 phosphopentomutase [Tropicibacter oceani]